MKNKHLIIAASIVAAGLVVLALALNRVAVQLAGLRQESSELVQRLESLSSEVPRLAQEAGDNAGRSAVKGAVDQAIGEPLRRLGALVKSAPRVALKADGNPKDENTDSPSETNVIPGVPVIHVEFVEPYVSIEISTDLEPSAIIPVRSTDQKGIVTSSTDQPEASTRSSASVALPESRE